MSAPTPEAPEPRLFQQTGGYRVGWNAWLALNASWPFGSLEVRADRLVLNCQFSHYIFLKSALVRLSICDGFLSSGLHIEHTIPDYPRFVVFWSSNIYELQERLRDAGFVIEDDDS